MTVAVVPAAGLSTRMGRAKLGLPLGNSTVLEWVLSTLRNGGVDRVLVVVGPHSADLIPAAESLGATALLLPIPTSDMRETVQAGLRWLEANDHPRAEDLWFLAPADCPAFSWKTVRQLLDLAVNDSASSIFIPTMHGRRGHPTLMAWKHAGEILRIPSGLGIDSYIRDQLVRQVPVDDPGILFDLDTPADYEKLQQSQEK